MFEDALVTLGKNSSRNKDRKSIAVQHQIRYLAKWMLGHYGRSNSPSGYCWWLTLEGISKADRPFPEKVRCCFDPTISTKAWKISEDGCDLRNDCVFFESFRASRGKLSGMIVAVLACGDAYEPLRLSTLQGNGITRRKSLRTA